MNRPTRILFESLDKALGNASRRGGYVAKYEDGTVEWFSLEYMGRSAILDLANAKPWADYTEADKWFIE